VTLYYIPSNAVVQQGLIRKRLVPFIMMTSTSSFPFHSLSESPDMSLSLYNSIKSLTSSSRFPDHINSDTDLIGQDVIGRVSGKVVGKVISIFGQGRFGFMMARLESICPSEAIESLTISRQSDKEEDNGFIRVIKPPFWSDIDPHTGKMINHVESNN